MKLAPVLTKYLIANKELRLPGLGIFRAEDRVDSHIENGKRSTAATIITFEQAKVTEPDEALIDYISNETGKMHVLAHDDVMSELEEVSIFLNTGKPYFINGLGTLTQKANGTITFHQEKFQHPEIEPKRPAPTFEMNPATPSYIENNRAPRKNKPGLIILLLSLIAVAATVWFYIKNAEKTNRNIEEVMHADTDTTTSALTTDQTARAAAPSVPVSNSYKYILEITHQPRASKRYHQLKRLNWPVEMETKDSVSYKLFIQLPRAGGDTTKIKDSLRVLSGKKVWIE